ELQKILHSVDYKEAEKKAEKISYKQKDNKYTNFFRNFKFFYEKAKGLTESQLNSFTRTLLDSCEVIEIKSWQVEQSITMFNSLNSDGTPLCDADIISARLYAIADENKVSDEFSDLWKEFIELIDGLKKNDIADIDAVLMQKMYYERAKGREMETKGYIDVTTPGLRRYFIEINKNLLNDPVGFCKQMINLANIWDKVSAYPVIQVLLKFSDNAKLFLASFLHRLNVDDISEDTVKDIAECLLRLFTILELVDVGYSSSAFKNFLFSEIMDMADNNISIQKIKADFDKHISEKWNPDEIKDYVIEYEKNRLVYLNEYLFAKENGISFSLGTKYDVEHIMPASGKNIAVIRKDAQISSEDEFKNTVNKLGNKILLEVKINRAVGNEWFRTKVSTKLSEKTGYIDSCYPIASALVKKYKHDSKPYWCKNDIDKATDIISDRIVKFIFGIS
ncbi:MAG: HNH endonuclease family protein, partial [Ruminococcus sp.]|nr:HNH endonuclease family protein [Ruminococcus sp.]